MKKYGLLLPLVLMLCFQLAAPPVYAQLQGNESGKTYSVEQLTTSPRDVIFRTGGTERARLKQASSIGRLELQGGLIIAGDNINNCDLTNKGALKMSCGRPMYCNGTSWATWPPGAEDRPQKMLAFVTSVGVQGGFASIGGGDAFCNARARAANLKGDYKAFLSEASTNIADQLESSSCTHKYYLVDGTTLIGNNLNDIMDGTLTAPINKTEYGATYNGNVWTGSTAAGILTGNSCLEWRNNINTFNGVYGNSAATDSTWANAGTATCENSYRLYCLEQPPVYGGTQAARVFVTSATYNGRWDRVTPSANTAMRDTGVGGAHAICQDLANDKGLGGSWGAWIANVGTLGSAPDYYFKKATSNPYTNLFGQKIASNWADLTDGTLDMGIAVDENYASIGSYDQEPRFWSNVEFNGRPVGTSLATQHTTHGCSQASWLQSWQASTGYTGRIGHAGKAWTPWTSAETLACDNAYHLMCVEQFLQPYTTYKKVFVTSQFYNGNLGGVAGADAKCMERAAAGGLEGTYKAWIADTTAASAPATRFTKPTVPYRTLDGRVVAQNWNDLVDGSDGAGDTIITPINVNEGGGIITAGAGVYTNVNTDGTRRSSDPNFACQDWTSTTGNGNVGLPAQMTNWTTGYNNLCSNTMGRLYCFEQ